MEQLPKVLTKSKKRRGRGYGSGVGGHTVGRGQKGQKSRGDISSLFEGVKMKKSLIRRLPLLRGKQKFSAKPKPFVVLTSELDKLKSSTVDMETLVKEGIVNDKQARSGVKILANGKLTKKLNVKVPVSKQAASLIETAGGTIE